MLTFFVLPDSRLATDDMYMNISLSHKNLVIIMFSNSYWTYPVPWVISFVKHVIATVIHKYLLIVSFYVLISYVAFDLLYFQWIFLSLPNVPHLDGDTTNLLSITPFKAGILFCITHGKFGLWPNTNWLWLYP